ncbi:acyclic terpene utilization AtuA family protein, partial [Salipiger marinus]|uniref:acyclic terpene utilization AtuA family protein n=1 Tax=Salipiger marinus TaxID=555512 RepID=UPI004059A8B3
MTTIRIGAGAGFQGDRIGPAVDLAERGGLDFLVFECLAERTIALAQQARLADPAAGFDPRLERRLRAVLPACAKAGTRIVTNMGAANPRAAAARARAVVAELGLDLKVAAVTGDDVLDRIGGQVLDETGRPARDLGARLISANAYIGVGGIVAALAQGADIVICGRASDPALFLAPLVHHFGWAMDDWTRLGRGTLVGHLLECSAQITGGYFADPGVKDVPGLAHLGFPLAEVAEDGTAVITKLPGTGGLVSRATCTEQLLYEIHDPARYMQPDVIADFSGVTLDQIGPDRVRVAGAGGQAPSGLLKVSVGYRDGWLGEGQISYAGA